MRLQKMFVLAGVIVILLIVLTVAWLLTTSKSVVWSYSERGEVSSTPTFAIFNPFREKKSEAEAERFLNILKNEGCEKAVLSLNNQRNYDDLCERESRYKLEDWKLSYRKDGEKTVELYYRVKRASDSNYSGDMRFDLEQKTDGWKVTDIEAIY